MIEMFYQSKWKRLHPCVVSGSILCALCGTALGQTGDVPPKFEAADVHSSPHRVSANTVALRSDGEADWPAAGKAKASAAGAGDRSHARYTDGELNGDLLSPAGNPLLLIAVLSMCALNAVKQAEKKIWRMTSQASAGRSQGRIVASL